MRATETIRVLSVDDHPLLREGIAGLLSSNSEVSLIAEASNGIEAVEQYRRHRPDVTLMDLQMPDMSGIDAIIAIRGEFPAARIIVLTTYSGDVLAQRVLKAGAKAYLLKRLVRKELLDTIRAVHAGQRWINSDVAMEIANHTMDDSLSDREIHVLRLVARGSSNRVIAAELLITEGTVKSHINNILSKLHARDRTHAVALALRRGVIGV